VTFANLPLLATAGAIEGQLIASGVTVGPVTTAEEVQDALWALESVALQVSAVTPTGNNDPDAGAHDELIGAVPPDTVGENVSAIGEPLVDEPDGAGHAILIPAGIPETSLDGSLLLPAESYDCTTK